jgi:hypothetical protein
MELQVLSEKLPVCHDSEAPFEVEITEREKCVNQTQNEVKVIKPKKILNFLRAIKLVEV